MTFDEIKTLTSKQPLGVDLLDGLCLLEETKTYHYYKFLYRLAKALKATATAEIGVQTARATAHLAAATNGPVIAVDPSPRDITDILHRYPNIQFHMTRGDDPLLLARIPDASLDLCFIDTPHTYDQVALDIKCWQPKVKSGGFILLDDITGYPGVLKFWNEIKLPKISLPELHRSGFGVVCIKR